MNDFSLHILDIAENSLTAGADNIVVTLAARHHRKLLVIRDNGKGVAGGEIKFLLSPFYTTRTTRRVGLGLALLEHLAGLCRGWVKVAPAKPRGITIIASFAAKHWDLPPDGNLLETALLLITLNRQCRFRFNYGRGDCLVRVDSRDFSDLDYFEIKRRLITGWEGQAV